jgi:hypothetical protein
VSLAATLSRIAELQTALAPPSAPNVAVGGDPTFSRMLQAAGPGAGAAAGVAPLAPPLPGGGGGAAALLAAAQKEVGVAEQPPGSNDSPRIAQYRQATAGSGVGPWCAYFASWAAREAGIPLGDQGQGFGLVDAVYAWAQKTGRANPADSGQAPRPGDLIVWDEHIGIVESVLPDGRVQTIEGNSSDQVARRVHAPGSALGYVRMS